MVAVRQHRILAASLAWVLTVTGCIPGPSLPTPSPATGVHCLGLPTQTCTEQIAIVEAQYRDETVVGIHMACLGTCTVSAGTIEVVVTRADGTVIQSSSAYGAAQPVDASSPPSLDIEPVCRGLPDTRCRERIASLPSVTPEGKILSAAVISCLGICTERDGRGETLLTMTDGTILTVGWQYLTGP
jgi:hypothetical protein